MSSAGPKGRGEVLANSLVTQAVDEHSPFVRFSPGVDLRDRLTDQRLARVAQGLTGEVIGTHDQPVRETCDQCRFGNSEQQGGVSFGREWIDRRGGAQHDQVRGLIVPLNRFQLRLELDRTIGCLQLDRPVAQRARPGLPEDLIDRLLQPASRSPIDFAHDARVIDDHDALGAVIEYAAPRIRLGFKALLQLRCVDARLIGEVGH